MLDQAVEKLKGKQKGNFKKLIARLGSLTLETIRG